VKDGFPAVKGYGANRCLQARIPIGACGLLATGSTSAALHTPSIARSRGRKMLVPARHHRGRLSENLVLWEISTRNSASDELSRAPTDDEIGAGDRAMKIISLGERSCTQVEPGFCCDRNDPIAQSILSRPGAMSPGSSVKAPTSSAQSAGKRHGASDIDPKPSKPGFTINNKGH
jgi:hypothetical protein